LRVISTKKILKKNSTTETFAALMLRINTPRWAGVPFYLKTGKCLEEKKTVIDIKFKQVDCLLTHSCPTPSNWLRLEIYPKEVFSLTLNVKKPGIAEEVIPVPMEFCHSCLFGDITPYAYEVVLQEVMRGEKSVSVRFDEIEAAWTIIDTVREKKLPVYSYAVASNGPEELYTEFEMKHGMRWRE
jgi:Glucose-6-phosphate 1-dehydrogenase